MTNEWRYCPDCDEVVVPLRWSMNCQWCDTLTMNVPKEMPPIVEMKGIDDE